MSNNKVVWVLLGCLLSFPALAEEVLIKHANIFSMVAGEAAIEDGQILLRDQKIAAIGQHLTVPESARVIDAGGRMVTPGLISSASQLGLTEVTDNAHSTDHSVSGTNLGAGFDVASAINPNSELLRVARADGLIYAVTLPGGSDDASFNGLGALLYLQDGPNVLQQAGITEFAQIGASSSASAGGSRAAQWQLMRTALQAASAAPKENQIQTASNVDELNQAAVQGLLNGQRPLLLDVRRESDIRQAIALKQEFGIRLVILGGTEAWRVAAELAAAEIPVILDAGFILPMNHDEYGVRADAARILQDAGVLIAFYPSFSLYYSLNAGTGARESAGFAVANGLSWEDGLRGLTVNPAKIWGLEQRAGTLAAGRPADLVIWDGDPLEPSSAPVLVMIAGQEVSLITRQILLRDRYHPNPNKSSWPAAYQ